MVNFVFSASEQLVQSSVLMKTMTSLSHIPAATGILFNWLHAGCRLCTFVAFQFMLCCRPVHGRELFGLVCWIFWPSLAHFPAEILGLAQLSSPFHWLYTTRWISITIHFRMEFQTSQLWKDWSHMKLVRWSRCVRAQMLFWMNFIWIFWTLECSLWSIQPDCVGFSVCSSLAWVIWLSWYLCLPQPGSYMSALQM